MHEVANINNKLAFNVMTIYSCYLICYRENYLN